MRNGAIIDLVERLLVLILIPPQFLATFVTDESLSVIFDSTKRNGGFLPDILRFNDRSVDDNDGLRSIMSTGYVGNIQQKGRSFSVKSSQTIEEEVVIERTFWSNKRFCVIERERLQDHIFDVPIYGSEAIVTYNICANEVNGIIDGIINNSWGKEKKIMNVKGKNIPIINIQDGYKATYSKEELVTKTPILFGDGAEIISDVTLKVFVTEKKDILAYFTTIKLADYDVNKDIEIFGVVVDAHTLELISWHNLLEPFAEILDSKEEERSHSRKKQKKMQHERQLYVQQQQQGQHNQQSQKMQHRKQTEEKEGQQQQQLLQTISESESDDYKLRNNFVVKADQLNSQNNSAVESDYYNPQNSFNDSAGEIQHDYQQSNYKGEIDDNGQQNNDPTDDIGYYNPENVNYCELCNLADTSVVWDEGFIDCPIHSLYLNDTGKTTICRNGTTGYDDSRGSNVVTGPAPVESLFWSDFFDCSETAFTDCYANVPFRDCPDASYDVQFVGLRTMDYLQRNLGLQGGLSVSANNFQMIEANTHYKIKFCNAFYFSGESRINYLAFGDCDCSPWGPMVAIDIVAHEIGHGVTAYTSELSYSGESGGMNEGFSDILGTVMEFDINDSFNLPDFTIGESIGETLRNMEDPAADGRSIANICELKAGGGGENFEIHHISGILNKAYVASVRACEFDGYDSLQNCALAIGNVFLYGNIQGLTALSSFMDGAGAVCSLIDEYVNAYDPDLNYNATEIKNFVRSGWDKIGVSLTDNCEAWIPMCPDQDFTEKVDDSNYQSSCFSPEDTVLVKGKGKVFMRKLQVGDMVLAANQQFKTVYVDIHYHHSKPTKFLQIHTTLRPIEKYPPLEITEKHMVFVVGKSHPISASRIKIGDYVQTDSIGNTHIDIHQRIHQQQQYARVTNITTIIRNGYYNPLTNDGTIVVNGIITSTYSTVLLLPQQQKQQQQQQEKNDPQQYQSIHKLFLETEEEYIRFGIGRKWSTQISQQYFLNLAYTPYRLLCNILNNVILSYVLPENGFHFFPIGGRYDNGEEESVNTYNAIGRRFVLLWRMQHISIQIIILIVFLFSFGIIHMLSTGTNAAVAITIFSILFHFSNSKPCGALPGNRTR